MTGFTNNWEERKAAKREIAKIDPEGQDWAISNIFSLDATTPHNKLNWGSGQLKDKAGVVHNISSGTTGTIASTTYIYFDRTVSLTQLQTTTITNDAVGEGKMLVGVVNPNGIIGKNAQYQIFGGFGSGVFITAKSIATDELLANEIFANDITASGTIKGAKLYGGEMNINNNFIVTPSGDVTGNNLTNKTIKFENLGLTPPFADGKLWCDTNEPNKKVLWGYFGGDVKKQQVSTSRMQYSSSFDKTSDDTIIIKTWFQPRGLIFNGFFMNISSDDYGVVNGNAGSASSQGGICSGLKLSYNYTVNAISSLSFNYGNSSTLIYTNNTSCLVSSSGEALPDGCITASSFVNGANWSNVSFDLPIATTFYDGDNFATNGLTPTARAYVSEWRDNGLTITIKVDSGNRLGGNFIILG